VLTGFKKLNSVLSFRGNSKLTTIIAILTFGQSLTVQLLLLQNWSQIRLCKDLR